MRLAWLLALLSTLTTAPALRAQATAANLLGKMQDVAVFPIFPITKSSNTYAEEGHGIEFLFGIGEKRRGMTKQERRVRCARLHESKPNCNPASRAETTYVLTQAERAAPGEPRTTFIESATITRLEVTQVSYEVAVGTRTTELRHTNVQDDWRLTGRIQEFPTLSLYGTFRPDWTVSPYLGVGYTLAELKSVRIAQNDSTASIDASTIGGWLALGGVMIVERFNIFSEISFSYLKFDTEQWKVPSNLTPQPASYPRHLELTGLRFTLGVQLSLDGS